MGWRKLKAAGESDERLFTVSAWREAPYFTDRERAALALAEAETRIADSSDPVPDEVWDQAASHFGEHELAALTVSIALTNLWNRVNITTRQVGGEWVKSVVSKEWMETVEK
jgi:alkylhydroperoxidase family enzyme